MKPQTFALVVLMLAMSGCSTKPPVPPAKIDQPDPAHVTDCPKPAPLNKDGVSVPEALDFSVKWIGVAGCERDKKRALVESWPK